MVPNPFAKEVKIMAKVQAYYKLVCVIVLLVIYLSPWSRLELTEHHRQG